MGAIHLYEVCVPVPMESQPHKLSDWSISHPDQILCIESAERRLTLEPVLRFSGSKPEPITEWNPLAGAKVDCTVNSWTATASLGDLLATVHIATEGGFLIIRSEVHLLRDSPEPITLLDWTWRSIRREGWPESKRLRWFAMTFAIWGEPALLPLDQGAVEIDAHWRAAVLDPEDREGLVWSYYLPSMWRHQFEMREMQLMAESIIDASVAPGETVKIDTAAVSFSGDVFNRMAGPGFFHVSRRTPREVRTHGAWNTWDFYHTAVNEEVVRENMEAISRHDWLREFVRYIVIDDGWEDRVGDWGANANFPRGMAAIATEISSAGFVPGLWSAPFFAEKGSRVFAEHPDWFVQYQGAPFSPFKNIGCEPPWGDRCYLDPTHPKIAEHVFEMYARQREQGFRYFKTDFLTDPFLPVLGKYIPERKEKVLVHHAPEQGPMRAHRRCMQAIRAAIGEESFWLGCGSIWASGAGLMDASRMSSDIAVYYRFLMRNGSSVLWNGHAHGSLWLNDPDFVVIRGEETQLDDLVGSEPIYCGKEAERPQFCRNEAEMWAALVILSGGMVVFSDRIAALNDTGIEILRIVTEYAGGEAGYPLDLEHLRARAIWKNDPGQPLLGLFNWSDEPGPALAPALLPKVQKRTWHNLWNGARLKTTQLPEYTMAPHSCLLLA